MIKSNKNEKKVIYEHRNHYPSDCLPAFWISRRVRYCKIHSRNFVRIFTPHISPFFLALAAGEFLSLRIFKGGKNKN